MKDRITAVMPVKLNNERLPGKNLRLLGDRPLLQYALSSLQKTGLMERIYVYCSSRDIVRYLPDGILFAERPKELDLPSSNFTQIFEAFQAQYDADLYVYAHATAPFVTVPTICQCVQAVASGEYDSAFCAVKMQDFFWKDAEPMNFDAADLPRSQDLEPIYRETSGVYVFTREVFSKYRRRVGIHPFIKTVSYKEAVDINTWEDFQLAEALLNTELSCPDTEAGLQGGVRSGYRTGKDAQQ